jgi:hypothetical protein
LSRCHRVGMRTQSVITSSISAFRNRPTPGSAPAAIARTPGKSPAPRGCKSLSPNKDRPLTTTPTKVPLKTMTARCQARTTCSHAVSLAPKGARGLMTSVKQSLTFEYICKHEAKRKRIGGKFCSNLLEMADRFTMATAEQCVFWPSR